MPLRKYAKRIGRKVVRAAKSRYFKGKGYRRPNLTTMVRDVALLKRSLNVEKKHIQSSITSNVNIGQCNVNADTGQAIYDITPLIVQGVGYSNMTGNSVKLVSMALKGQLKQMSGCQHPMRVKMVIFKSLGVPQTATAIQSGNLLFDINPLTSCTDFNSERNVNYFRDYSVIKTKYLYLQPDPVSGELMITNFSHIMKLSHHLKWNQNTTTLTDGQILVGFFSDSGNSGATASTLPNVPIKAINSGATIQFFTKFYFVDN